MRDIRSQSQPAFTVFTPTYDRAATLPRVKACLEAQTTQDFEWLIVDDGSTDGTGELVASWEESSPLDIRYFYQPNSGKHVAFNRGVREARGKLFLTLDSDDECLPQALERFLYHWESIPTAERLRYSAVTALCIDESGRIVGKPFPVSPYDSDPLHLYFDSKAIGDKWGFHRTDVLRRYPFPEPAGVKFVSESLVWFRIGRHHKTRYVNEPLLVIHTDAPGERLHLLSNRTVRGRHLFHQDVITRYLDLMSRSPLLMLKSGINYCRYSFHLGILPVQQMRGVARVGSRLLVVACLVPGVALFVRDKAAAILMSNRG